MYPVCAQLFFLSSFSVCGRCLLILVHVWNFPGVLNTFLYLPPPLVRVQLLCFNRDVCFFLDCKLLWANAPSEEMQNYYYYYCWWCCWPLKLAFPCNNSCTTKQTDTWESSLHFYTADNHRFKAGLTIKTVAFSFTASCVTTSTGRSLFLQVHNVDSDEVLTAKLFCCILHHHRKTMESFFYVHNVGKWRSFSAFNGCVLFLAFLGPPHRHEGFLPACP